MFREVLWVGNGKQQLVHTCEDSYNTYCKSWRILNPVLNCGSGTNVCFANKIFSNKICPKQNKVLVSADQTKNTPQTICWRLIFSVTQRLLQTSPQSAPDL